MIYHLFFWKLQYIYRYIFDNFNIFAVKMNLSLSLFNVCACVLRLLHSSASCTLTSFILLNILVFFPVRCPSNLFIYLYLCGLNWVVRECVIFFFTCTQDIAQEAVKKRRRTTKKPYSRSIVGATLEVIQKRRTEKAEVRDAAREAALRCVFIMILIYALSTSRVTNPKNRKKNWKT